jgi:hypothetical protein
VKGGEGGKRRCQSPGVYNALERQPGISSTVASDHKVLL